MHLNQFTLSSFSDLRDVIIVHKLHMCANCFSLTLEYILGMQGDFAYPQQCLRLPVLCAHSFANNFQELLLVSSPEPKAHW